MKKSERRFLVWLIVASIVVGGTGAWVITQTGRHEVDNPGRIHVPALKPGTVATYEATGDYQNLLDDPGWDTTGNRTQLEPGTRLTVHIDRITLPNATGQLHEVDVTRVFRGTELYVASAARQDGAPVARFNPAKLPHAGDEPFEPLARVEYSLSPDGTSYPTMANTQNWDQGFADAFLWQDRSIPTRKVPLVSWDPYVGQQTAWFTGLEAYRIQGTDAKGTDRVRAEVDRADGTTAATYTYGPRCSLPDTVQYLSTDGSPKLDMQLVGCTVEKAPPPGTLEGWPKPERAPFEKTYPGQGDALPLSYREGLAFFLSLPATQEYTSNNADWVLWCATLRRGEPDPGFSPWSWRFDLTSGNGNLTGWITRGSVSPVIEEGWVRDPDPPQIDAASPCSRIIGQAFPSPSTLPGRIFATVDSTHQAFDGILDQASYQEDAVLSEVRIGPIVTVYELSRCSVWLDKQGGGFCSETPPSVFFLPAGAVTRIDVEQDHYGEGFAPLVAG